MSGEVRITANGHDVTEGVQALYDLLLSSMDLGSGFLSEDELVPVFRAAVVVGFDTSELEEHLVVSAVGKRMDLWRGQNPEPRRDWRVPTDPVHLEWRKRKEAARKVFQDEEVAALRAAYGLREGHIADANDPQSQADGE